jgi:hypothetical protein
VAYGVEITRVEAEDCSGRWGGGHGRAAIVGRTGTSRPSGRREA